MMMMMMMMMVIKMVNTAFDPCNIERIRFWSLLKKIDFVVVISESATFSP